MSAPQILICKSFPYNPESPDKDPSRTYRFPSSNFFLVLGINSYHSRLFGCFSQFPSILIWRGHSLGLICKRRAYSQVIKLSEEYVLRVIKSQAIGKFSFIHETNNHTVGWSTGGTHWDVKYLSWSSCHWLRLCRIYLKWLQLDQTMHILLEIIAIC